MGRIRVFYDKRRNLNSSMAVKGGLLGDRVIIGIKDSPTRNEIIATIKHEKSHLLAFKGKGGVPSHYESARRELLAYSAEKRSSSAVRWNRVLPVRIHDFLPYVSWLSKREQGRLRPSANKILNGKIGGGNESKITTARNKLKNWWI